MIYPTAQNYIEQVIVPALGSEADNFDIEAVAADMLLWKNVHNENGDVLLDESGLVENENRDFWDIVAGRALA